MMTPGARVLEPRWDDFVTEGEAGAREKKKGDKLIGAVLAGKYRILQKIGEGGMGSVYIATQEPIDRKVAIKLLLKKLTEDEIAVKRFEQEARAISKMQHPNTVTIYDFDRVHVEEEDDERLYIVMEYLKGRTLTQLLRSQGVLPPARACRIMRQVCASLSDAHATGIIHRDLKPDNIFLTEVGGDKDWVKVLDFGVAKLAHSEAAGTLTQTGMIFGTPKYMSPEQAEGRPIDYRADIYALGVVLYELLMGRPPFVADTPVGLLLKHISEPPAPFQRIRPDLSVPAELEAIVAKALAKLPEHRYQMVLELSQDLANFEQTLTGAHRFPSGFTAATPIAAPGLPTEVIPGTMGGSHMTPAGLAAPGDVPSGLSLGRPKETLALDVGGTGVVQQATEPRDVVGARAFGSSDGWPGANTRALPVGGAETLGGEISAALRPRARPSNLVPMLGGIAFLIAAAGVVVFAMRDSRQATRVESLSVEGTAIAPPSAPTAPIVEAPARVVEEVKPIDATPVQAVAPNTDVRTPPSNATRTKEPASDRRSEAVLPERKVRFTVDSEPEGAMVFVAGEEIGKTPLTTDFPREPGVLTLTMRKSGFREEVVVRSLERDQNVRVELVRETDLDEATPVRRCADGSKPPCKAAPVPKDRARPDSDEKLGDLK